MDAIKASCSLDVRARTSRTTDGHEYHKGRTGEQMEGNEDHAGRTHKRADERTLGWT